MTDDDFAQLMDQRIRELSADVRDRAVAFLRDSLPEEIKADIRRFYVEHGMRWIGYMSLLKLPNGRQVPRGHFDWGMRVRNALREQGLLDDMLPEHDQNWDSYYIQCVELAVGLRTLEGAG